MFVDGSSPYAEFLPQRFRQYNPDKKIFEKGQQAVISGGDEYVDPMLLMRANFGGNSRASHRPKGSRAGSPKPSNINFYNQAKNSQNLSPDAKHTDFDRASASKASPMLEGQPIDSHANVNFNQRQGNLDEVSADEEVQEI